MITETLSALAFSAVAAFLVMTGLWLVQRRTGNAGIVDIGWSATIPLLATLHAVMTGSLSCPRTQAALVMAWLWGGRLVLHIHRRSHGKPEDARYQELRRAWGDKAQAKLFLFFHFQGAAALLFSIPFLLVMLPDCRGFAPLEFTGMIVWLMAWLGEGAADRQLARFKRDPSAKGKVCETGWWNYSRHPNYFFEWLIWCGIALYAWSSPHGYLAIICPALMLFFLFKVTGIPATEEQALRSKGEAYRQYQQTTSAFIPWLKKR